MSKKAKLSKQHVSEISQQVSDHLKQTGHGQNGAVQSDPALSASAGDRTKRGAFFWGAASGIAVMLAAPAFRPLAKSVVKAGLKVGRHAQHMGTSLKEDFQDITAEARAEIDREQGAEDHHHSDQG